MTKQEREAKRSKAAIIAVRKMYQDERLVYEMRNRQSRAARKLIAKEPARPQR